jgi:pantetheine-phosphate adenylyltransferase
MNILEKIGAFSPTHNWGYLHDVYGDHRHYHSLKHIEKMLSSVDYYEEKYSLSIREVENLQIAIAFHDAVYDPRKNDNEEQSAKKAREFLKACHPDSIIGREFPDYRIEQIEKLVLATKCHDPFNNLYEERSLEAIIISLDTSIIFSSDFSELVEWEYGIFKEYQFVSVEKYIEERVKFLEKYKSDNINALIRYVKTRKYKIGIYAGSFNPLHIGHMNIIKKAEEVFDKVVIARGINPEKNNEKFPIPELTNEVVEYSGLVTELFKNKRENVDLFLIRVLRNEHDLPQEENFRKIVHDLDKTIKFMYFFSDDEFEHISSSMIRGLIPFNKEKAERYIVK